ncbi:MAG: methylated-DNA--[protein]-cysteine S-methyltransferase [Candidatus Thorarchaeota archaeon]|nr:MAG: methylated-DNA--[protein]-cysteine S-methyltransferase [Candidatus Thorarchaeota archaeon]
MYFRVFETAFGFSAIIYKETKDAEIAKEILLPRDIRAIRSKVRALSPEAKETVTGAELLVSLITRFFDGEGIEIPWSLVDRSVCSDFQLRVLDAECTVPRGKAISYSELARRANTKSARAAGSALARNPFPIVVPCHRAIRSDRSLGGYQGGRAMKKRILIMEGVCFDENGRVLPDSFIR